MITMNFRNTAKMLPAIALALLPTTLAAKDDKPAPPPPGAVILFDGKDVSGWNNPWPVEKGAMTVKGGNTVSKKEYSDALLHIEFRCPLMADKKGQARGNSGVYLQGRYEIQVLDSYGIADPGQGDCGAVYNQSAPLVNACKPPQQWQTYDIIFRAARLNADGSFKTPPRVTVFQNGTLIQNNVEISGPTAHGPNADNVAVGPLLLQDHAGNPVSYRNIWVLPLKPEGATHY